MSYMETYSKTVLKSRATSTTVSAGGGALVLAIDGAGPPTSAGAVAVAGAAVGPEARLGARDLLAVTRALLLAHHRRHLHAAISRAPTAGSTTRCAVETADVARAAVAIVSPCLPSCRRRELIVGTVEVARGEGNGCCEEEDKKEGQGEVAVAPFHGSVHAGVAYGNAFGFLGREGGYIVLEIHTMESRGVSAIAELSGQHHRSLSKLHYGLDP
jgi:hypothetical protein